MNRLTSRGVGGSLRNLLTLGLMVLVAQFAVARVGSAKAVAQQSGALTYTGTVLHTFEFTDGSQPQAGLVADSGGICMAQQLSAGPVMWVLSLS